MAVADEVYTRIIGWLKVLLPLAALGLLSTLFLLSSSREPLQDVPFADALGGGETARQGIGAPYYSGTTARGDLLTMTARTARPLANGVVVADTLEAQMKFQTGGAVTLLAENATVRDAEDTALMEGGVRIDSSTGYTLTTESLTTALDRIDAESLGPVAGSGPLGTLEAGGMRIETVDTSGAVQLLFTKGVKLVYQPPDEKGPDQ